MRLATGKTQAPQRPIRPRIKRDKRRDVTTARRELNVTEQEHGTTEWGRLEPNRTSFKHYNGDGLTALSHARVSDQARGARRRQAGHKTTQAQQQLTRRRTKYDRRREVTRRGEHMALTTSIH
eukprot:7901817-Pyramimonas_sp.AAC.1